MNAAIGELAERDAAAVIALWREAGLTRPWNDPAADLARALGSPGSTVLAARDGPDVVATVMAGFDGHRGWLHYLAVAEVWRRRGLGRRMVAAAELWLAERGAPKVQLMVRGGNDAARGFYRALGYEDNDVAVVGRRLEGRGEGRGGQQ